MWKWRWESCNSIRHSIQSKCALLSVSLSVEEKADVVLQRVRASCTFLYLCLCRLCLPCRA